MRKTRPSIVFIILASALAGGYCLASGVGVLITNELRISATIRQAADKLHNADLAQSKSILRDRIENPPLEYRLVKLLEGDSAGDRLELAVKYLQAPETVKLGQATRINAAKAWIENEDDTPANTAILENFERAQSILENIGIENSKGAAFTQSSSQLNTEYLVVAKRFGSLLSLEPIEPQDDARELPVYRNGYLAGLPKLSDLRDEIESVEQLGERLASIGGKVTIEGRQVAAAFDEEIVAIRSLTSALSVSRQQLREEEDLSDKRRVELKQELLRIADRVAKLTATQLDEVSGKAPTWAKGREWYGNYRQQLERARELVLGTVVPVPVP